MAKQSGCKKGMHGAKIDKVQFEKLCALMCREDEICDFFGVSHDTLNRWAKDNYGCTYYQASKKCSAVGKISLRRIQFKQAETYPVMAIWLGKQILGQTEKVEAEVNDRIEIINDVRED